MWETTASRLWRQLSRDDRLAAARHFWRDPHREVVAQALAAIVKARHLRPQVARSLPDEDKARALASLLDPGESVAASLLAALHLGERRLLLTSFLDSLGLPHEDGLLKEAADEIEVSAASARAGVRALADRYPEKHVRLYLNTLWLQDRERWHMLEQCPEWILGAGEMDKHRETQT